MIESVSDPYDRKARFAAGRGAVVNVEHAKAWSGSLKWQRLKAHLPLKKKARSKSGLWCSGGAQFTTKLLAIGANEHMCVLLRVKRQAGGEPARIAYHGVHQQ